VLALQTVVCVTSSVNTFEMGGFVFTNRKWVKEGGERKLLDIDAPKVSQEKHNGQDPQPSF
jgi:hypothetical protein